MSSNDEALDDIFSILEEAEKTLQKPKREYKRKDNTTVLRFVRKRGVAQGTVRVPNYLIFHQYIQFMHTSCPNDKAGKTEFFRTFNRHFTQARTGKQRYYLLNDALDLSPEAYKRAKFYENSVHVKNSKKKKD